MKCCSRYTLGVIIGSLYTVACSLVFILMGFLLIEILNDKENHVKSESIISVATIMALALLLALISGLLIYGIVKRRHNCMLTWLLFYIIGFFFSCIMFYFGFVGAAMGNASKTEFIALLTITVVATVLQIMIFCFMCSLYKAIRRQNIDKPRLVIGSPQIGHQSQAYHYTVVKNYNDY